MHWTSGQTGNHIIQLPKMEGLKMYGCNEAGLKQKDTAKILLVSPHIDIYPKKLLESYFNDTNKL